MARIRSTKPAPWKERSRFKSVAAPKKISFTRSGSPMNSRRTERNAAITPLTCGAAMLVPLSSTYSHCFPSARSINNFPVAAERIFSPGATTSGFILPSPVGPFEEKYDTPYTCGISRCVDPTVMASSALPGSLIVTCIGIRCPLLRRQRAVASVASCHYHHYTRSHQAIDFNAQGTLSTGEPLGIEIVSETDVNSVDQIQTAVAVLFLDVRDCRNQIADFAVTFVVEHLQTNETTIGRHAANRIEHN